MYAEQRMQGSVYINADRQDEAVMKDGTGQVFCLLSAQVPFKAVVNSKWQKENKMPTLHV